MKSCFITAKGFLGMQSFTIKCGECIHDIILTFLRNLTTLRISPPNEKTYPDGMKFVKTLR